mmetsp:Transcript_17441/g.25037  ORF Transcript_17441/g.25037 Transcript_17441/m.25037 type:complete len:137 (-) Transcript_17441:771-1181(-)
MVVGFVAGVGATSVPSVAAVCGRDRRMRKASRVVVRMAEGKTDVEAAQDCLEEGCEVNEVQEILGRLDMKKQALELELESITNVMAMLAKANLSEDRSFVAQTVEAAINIFQRAEDTYPKVGSPSPWTMDKPKKKR